MVSQLLYLSFFITQKKKKRKEKNNNNNNNKKHSPVSYSQNILPVSKKKSKLVSHQSIQYSSQQEEGSAEEMAKSFIEKDFDSIDPRVRS